MAEATSGEAQDQQGRQDAQDAQDAQDQQQTQDTGEAQDTQDTGLDGGEPGGAEGTDVRARKLYRTAKRIQEDLEREREEKIRLEERLKALEEQKQAPQSQQPLSDTDFYSAVQAKVDSGEWTEAQARQAYGQFERKKIKQELEIEQKARKPLEKAVEEIDQYKALLPWLNSRTSDKFLEVKAEYDRLTGVYGLPGNEVTEALAVRNIAGSLEKLRRQQAMASQTRNTGTFHAETGAGNADNGEKKLDISKAPDNLKAFWEATGTPQKTREIEFQNWKKHHQ
jgi:hypothetical protein